ncbi:CMD domain protein [Agrococcus beijingensis]|uniref:CMD domain protein n=1 Tax=Agrococcus beijingensis TaxID=3068634 RepID=UPI002742776D|nr:CMD domain protein [Agrococcus sp. REN33]
MSHDVIDHLAGIAPGSPLDAIRHARPDAREHAQQSFLALLEPAEPGQLELADRYAVAAYVALLHDPDPDRPDRASGSGPAAGSDPAAGDGSDPDGSGGLGAAAPTRPSAFYLELLADATEPAVVAAVRDAADAGRASGPYGDYREPGLQAEAVAGPVAAIDCSVLGTRLAAALEHAHLLVLHPRDARPEALQALVDAGWEADALVSLSQLVAFLAFQLRLVHGLRVLADSPAPATDPATDLQEARA